MVLVSVLLAFFVLGIKEDKSSSDSNIESDYWRDFDRANEKFSLWWSSIFWAALPQALVSICYRFDFDNAAALRTSPATESRTETTTPISTAVLLPKRVSRQFSKPYYMVTLAAWCLVNVAMLYLAAVDVIRFDGDNAYGMITAIFATPSMVLAIIALAAVRGELKKMWIYKEVWAIAPVADAEIGQSSAASVGEAEAKLSEKVDEIQEEA